MRHLRLVAGAAVALLIASAAACTTVPPSGSGGLGGYSGLVGTSLPATITYTGTAGEHLNVGGYLPGGQDSGATLQMYDPSRNLILTLPGYMLAAHPVLPATGRYTFTMHVTNAIPAGYEIALSHDLDKGTLSLNTGLDIPTYAQTFTYHYAGTAGEHLDTGYGLTFIAPDNTPVPVGNTNFTDGQITLPFTGDYQVIDRFGGAVSHDLDGGVITLGETVLPPLMSGQHVIYTYAGTAGELVNIGDIYSGVGVADPNGNQVQLRSLFGFYVVLPVTGTYQIAIYGEGEHGDIYLNHTLETGPISLGTTPTPVVHSGQLVHYSYEGIAGQKLRIAFPATVHPDYTSLIVYAPNGDNLGSFESFGPGWPTSSLLTLPVTGTYDVYLKAADAPPTSYQIILDDH